MKVAPTDVLDEAIEPPAARGWLAKWLSGGPDLAERAHAVQSEQAAWYTVIWLTGVDYFSSLAYQAGIALIAAGMLAPVATAVLALVTVFCAVPVYRQVARRSYAGQGSIAILEHLLSGWWSKLVVILLLGFAGTDFVITMTLSAADSARHAVENPYLKPYIGHLHFGITVALLLLLALVFLRGFREAMRLAVVVAVPYVILNAIIIGRCFLVILRRPDLISNWHAGLFLHGGSWTGVALASAIIFPRLALGLSGFETGVAVMPLIRGDENDERQDGPPEGRIRNTGKLLLTAALLMSILLLTSSFVTTLLVPESAYRVGGPASGRALAYLAHDQLGKGFGTIYDLSTILILWFAGASAMAGLLHLIPRYLPRLGMAPQWAERTRPLVLVLFAIDLAVTLAFRASVDGQAGAYATGVLVLIFSAALSACLYLWREAREAKDRGGLMLKSIYCGLCASVFAYTLVRNVQERPDGIIISSIFIALLILSSVASRYRRSTELRVQKCEFRDSGSQQMWDMLRESRINLIPISTEDEDYRRHLRDKVAHFYNLHGPMTFVHVGLLDDRSEFYEKLCVCISRSGDDYLIKVDGANVVANTVAYLSLALRAKTIVLGLSQRGNLLSQLLMYFLLGTGEVGLMVYEILLNYWLKRPESERPLLFLMAG